MYSKENKYHILNCKNSLKQTPLYVASKHGHLDVIKFLLEKGANPHLKSKIDKHEFETILEVCVRWHHIPNVEFLLTNIKWSKEEIKFAYKYVSKESDQHRIKSMLNQYSK